MRDDHVGWASMKYLRIATGVEGHSDNPSDIKLAEDDLEMRTGADHSALVLI